MLLIKRLYSKDICIQDVCIVHGWNIDTKFPMKICDQPGVLTVTVWGLFSSNHV